MPVLCMCTIAGGELMCTGVQGGMFGYSGDHPPGDVKGHEDFIKSLRQPDVWEVSFPWCKVIAVCRPLVLSVSER